MLSALHILTLLKLPRYGRKTVHHIMDGLDSPPETLMDLLDAIKEASNTNSKIKVPIFEELKEAFELANVEHNGCQKMNIYVMGWNDSAFPNRLKAIPDAPVLLYAKGNVSCLNNKLTVALIGTREPTKYGILCGERFAGKLANEGFVVISGLAKGIDAASHLGCLKANGTTVAVLANGLDSPIYPKENRKLAEDILIAGGCLISEYGLNIKSRPHFFVERDRIQSGLSCGVIVIETDIKGGTMHTVKFAKEQNKILGCLNHPGKYLLNNNKALGNQELITEGSAMALFTNEELTNFINKMIENETESTNYNNQENKSKVTKSTSHGEQLNLF